MPAMASSLIIPLIFPLSKRNAKANNVSKKVADCYANILMHDKKPLLPFDYLFLPLYWFVSGIQFPLC